jgi:hypothetical protein
MRPQTCASLAVDVSIHLSDGPLGRREHQIPICCFQPFSLVWSVNDAVNVLPCATSSYLDGGRVLTCAAFPGRRWPSGRHQTTDLAVGGSNPSRRATITAAQRHCDRVVDSRWVVGLRPNCDHVSGHSQHDCDHLRPQSPIPPSLLLVSVAVRAWASGQLWALSASNVDERASSAEATVGRRVSSQLMVPARSTACRCPPHPRRRPASVAFELPTHGKDGSPVRFRQGAPPNKGNRHPYGLGAPAHHRGLVRGHNCRVMRNHASVVIPGALGMRVSGRR